MRPWSLAVHRSLTGQALQDAGATRYDGFFPANLEHHGQLAEVAATIAGVRGDATAPYDFVVSLPVGVDPHPWQQAGATWWLPEFAPDRVSSDQVRGVLRDGPLAG